MPRLDPLLVVHGVHEKSRWRHVGCRRAYDALLEAADLERGARLPTEIRGETVLRALANCGLSVDRRDVSRRLLASVLVDVRDAREGDATENEARAGPNTLTHGASVSLGRFAALLALQCGGALDEKLDVLFRAADRDATRVSGNETPRGRLTERQTVDALAVHAYDPADIANPALARHYRVLECQALDVPWTDADERDADATRPPSAAELERVGVKEPVEAFKRAVYGENHDAEASEELSKPPQAKRSRPIGAGLADDGPIDFAALARLDRLERCTAATLKAYCKEHELKTTGVKSALAERVKAHALLGER